MNLEDFVKESLSQIFRGVQSIVAKETGGEIAPRVYGKRGFNNHNGRPIGMISFDVAVTVTEAGE